MSVRGLGVLAVIVGLIAANGSDAQSSQVIAIAGSVADSASGEPIPGVSITLVELRRIDVTHTDGSFDFLVVPDGGYTLRATRIGLRPATVRVRVVSGRAPSVAIKMVPTALQLGAIVSTGTLTTKAAQDVLSPTGVVQGIDLDRELKSTMAATLMTQPGVTMSTLGPATARPVIRGFSGDRVLVLEDGARTGDMSSTSSDHAVTVDPATVKQFEVVRGPMSLLYGSSALGGVVNAIREEVPTTRSEHVAGTFSSGVSSVDEGATAGGYATKTSGAFTGRIEGNARRAGDQRTPLGTLDNTAVDTYSLAGGGSLIGDDRYAGGSYRYFNNSYGVPGGFVGGHANGVHINMRKHAARAEAEKRAGIGPFESVKGTGTFTNYSHEEIESGGSLGTKFHQMMVSGDVLGRHGPHGLLSEGAIGARWQFRDIKTGGTLRTPSTYDNTGAVFVVEELVRGALHLQAGGRFDFAKYVPKAGSFVTVNGVDIPALPRTFASPSGSFGLLYDVAPGINLGGSIARAYRTPDFNELYSNGPHLASFSFEVGNPRIGEESGIGTDAFVRVNRSRVTSEVAVFRNRMHDFIFERNTGDLGLQGNRPKFQFTGREAVLWGSEGRVEATMVQNIVFETTVSYVRGQFIGKVDSLPADSAHGIFFARPGSENIPLMPPLNGRVGLRWERDRWNASVGSRFAAAQKELGDFETETAGYGLLDASVGTRLINGARFHAITLRGENLLDKVYRNHLSRTKDVLPEAGRNVSLLYRITF